MEDEYLENSFALRFTYHARLREKQRKTKLDLADTRRLEKAVQVAQDQGRFKRTAFFLDRAVFVIDVTTSEIITIMSEFSHSGTNLYINDIDSAVIVAG